MSFYLSFTEWDFLNPPQLVGFANFQTIFREEIFFETVSNTILLVLGIVPLNILLAMFLAGITNEKIKGLGFFKASFFLPMVTSPVAIALVWYWLFAPDMGLINYFLSLIGIAGPGWLADPTWSKVSVILMSVWRTMGYSYLIFLAGYKGISREYYEAAAIDGANKRQQFRYITFPLLSPTTFFLLITTLIGVFNLFDEPFILTRGGPVYSTYTIVMYIYYLAFRFFRMGEAAVVSILLFIGVVVLTLIQFKIAKRWVHYGA